MACKIFLEKFYEPSGSQTGRNRPNAAVRRQSNQDGKGHRPAEFSPTIEERIMNKDQVKGRMKEAAGTVEQKVGKATGSIKTQAKGLGKEVAGKVQKTVGDARNDADHARDEE